VGWHSDCTLYQHGTTQQIKKKGYFMKSILIFGILLVLCGLLAGCSDAVKSKSANGITMRSATDAPCSQWDWVNPVTESQFKY
jgi:hypothetical protein